MTNIVERLRQKQARIDRLAEALSELLNDLEERAKWNHDDIIKMETKD